MVKEKLDFTGLSKEDEPTFTYKGLELEKGKFDYSGLKKEPPKPKKPTKPTLGVPTIPAVPTEDPQLVWTPPKVEPTKPEFETVPKLSTGYILPSIEIKRKPTALEKQLNKKMVIPEGMQESFFKAERYKGKDLAEKFLANLKAGKYNTEVAIETYKKMIGMPNQADLVEGIMQNDPDYLLEQDKLLLKWMRDEGAVSNFVRESAASAVQLLPMWTYTAIQSLDEAAAGATAGAVLGTAASAPGAAVGAKVGVATGFKVGMIDTMRKIEGGNAYREYLAQGIEPEVAVKAAHVVGLINGFVEQAQFGTVMKMFGAPGKSILANTKKNIITKVGQLVAKQAAFVTSEALEEMIQRAVTIGGKEMSKALSLKQFKRMTAKEVFKDLSREFVSALGTFSILGAPSIVTNSSSLLQKEQAQEAMARELEPKAKAISEGAKPTEVTPSKDVQELRAVDKFAFYEGRPAVAKPVEQTSQPEKIIKRSDIIKEISNKLDVPVRRGKFRGKGVLGIFKPQQQVVRVKEGGFETISHEVGHYLHHTISDVNKIIENNPELKNLDYDQNKKRATEGFSEYLRYYLTQPEKAPEVAPQFHRVFNTLMDAKYPKIKEILDAARDNYKLWLEMPSVAKTESHISFNSPRPKSITIGDIYTSTIDDLYPIHKYSKLAKEYKDIQPSEDPYVLARLYRGWTGKPEHFFRRGTFDPYTLKITGQPLTSILRPIDQMKALKEFSIYLVAKRVPELTGRGIQTGINKEDAIQTVKDLESAYPIFENAKTRYRAYNMRLMQYLYKGGLLSREDFVKIIRNNREYAPFFRVHEELTRNGYMGKGFSKIASPVKRIGGSEADIIDPLESTLKNTYTIINAVERNKVGQALIRLSSLSPELGRIVERVSPKMAKVVTARLDEAFRQIKMYMPPEMKEAMKQIAFDIYRPSMFLDDNIIQVMEGGKKYYYQVDPTLYRAIQGMDAEQINTIFKIMSYPAKWLRAGATALNPDFLGRNVFRDQLTASIYSEYGYKPFIDVYGGAASIVNQDELFWKWMRSGGAHAAIVSMDRNYLRHNLRELMRGRFKTYSPVEAVRAISEIGESATRLGEFKLALQKTGDPLKASMASREVSVDFGVHGSKTQALSSIIAFFNPNIQGTSKLIKAFKNRPKKTMLAVIAGITVPSMLLYMHNRKSERYKELPKWEKDLFWIVDVGENKPLIRIPKPFELGILFGSVPERMLEWMDTQNPEAFDGMTESIINGFVPGVMPTAATPFIENYTNKSFFTGKPVESEAVTREIPSERYYRYTPSVARWIGKRLGMSPIKIHQFVRGWFGGVGVMAMEFPDNVMKASGNADLPMSPKDIPLIKSFIARDPYGLSSYSIGKFYDDYKKIAQYHTTINRLESEEKYQEANKIRRSHPEWKYYDDYSAMSREIADMRSSQEYTLNRKDLTPEQKKKIIDAKNKNLTRFVRKFNEQHR